MFYVQCLQNDKRLTHYKYIMKIPLIEWILLSSFFFQNGFSIVFKTIQSTEINGSARSLDHLNPRIVNYVLGKSLKNSSSRI
jgi:hypothetical protein